MKTWIKRTLIAVAGATLVLGTLTACGYPGGHHEGHRGEHRHGGWSEERITEMRGKAVDRVSRQLNLNAEQRKKLDALANEMQASQRALQGEGPAPREALAAMLASSTMDRQAATQFLNQKTQVVQSRSPQVINAMGDFFDSLTPDQQAQVRAFLEKRRGWRRS
jgi:periplasmic protein CpxP/Spy